MTTGEVARERIPDWQLERHFLRELPDGEAAVVEDTLARRTDLRERLSALERSNDEILRRHPPAEVAAAIRSRLAAERVRAHSGVGNRVALAAALGLAAAVSAVWVTPRPPMPAANGDVVRSKGLAPQLLLYRNGGGTGVERLDPGAVARRHDVVQLAYRSAGRRHGVIVSVDGAGLITRHLPAVGSQAAPLEGGAAVALPEAYELDDAPGFERFYLVTADQPFAVATVVEAVRRGAGAQLDLPDSMDQFSFVLAKESAR
jgi:hypothetical protein